MSQRDIDARERALADFEALGGTSRYDADVKDLDLSNSAVTDADLTRLADLPDLQSLHLSYTAVTDDAMEHVRALPGLRLLTVIGTDVSAGALKRLKKDRPHLEIHTTPRVGTRNPFTGGSM